MSIKELELKLAARFVIYPEDDLVLFAAVAANSQHKAIVLQVQQELNALLDKQDSVRSLSKEDQKEICRLLSLHSLLRAESKSESENPFGIYTLAQLFYYQQQDLIAEIQRLRAHEPNRNEELIKKYNQLKIALLTSSNNLTKQMLDESSRRAHIEMLYEAFKARGLIGTQALFDIDEKHHFFMLTTGAGEIIASATRVILLLTRHLGHLYEALPFFAGSFVLLGTLATMLVSGHKAITQPDSIEMHTIINNIATVAAGFINVGSHVLDAVKSIGSASLSQSLSWSPFIGTVATVLLLGVEIGNIVRAEVKFHNHISKLNLLLTEHADGTPGSAKWLKSGQVLSVQEQELRDAFLKHACIDDVINNFEAIQGLFTEEEFNEQVKPALLKHAKIERDKSITKHSVNAGILLAVGGAGLAFFFFPGFGVPMAVGLISFLVLVFIAKLFTYNTVLKNAKYTSIDSLKQQAKDMQRQTPIFINDSISTGDTADFEIDTDPKTATAFAEFASDYVGSLGKAIKQGLDIDLDLVDAAAVHSLSPSVYVPGHGFAFGYGAGMAGKSVSSMDGISDDEADTSTGLGTPSR